METIESKKEMLRGLSADVLRNSNSQEPCDSYYNEITLESVEEDIALWKKREFASNNHCYFYTNSEGSLLFDGRTFQYATPFSNSRACVSYNNIWYIIDLERKEMVSLPSDITFQNINGFRNDNLALFNNDTWHWGSIQYNPEEKSFERNIPFIWDVLEFSRLKGQVFVGIHHVDPIRHNHPYFHCNEDFGDMFTIPAIQIPTSKAYDLNYYNYMKNEYIRLFDQNVLQYIQEKIESTHTQEERRQIIKDYIKTAYNVSDFYFEESFKEEIKSNSGAIIDDTSFKDYQKRLGKVKEISGNNGLG